VWGCAGALNSPIAGAAGQDVSHAMKEKPESILAQISQETLAELIGTTRSRVSFFQNNFRKLGFIDYNGVIEVHSSLLNVVLHDEPHIEI
jgi:CRP/FNR family cyclic AMP-dependent transcriptional regulator